MTKILTRRQALAAGTSAAGVAVLGAPTLAFANDAVKFMIPANPGGGWDQTGRLLGKSMIEAGVAKTAQFENRGGAGGALGLAQFANASKGDGSALMVMGAVMLGAFIQTPPAIGLRGLTPLARLITEFNTFVVPAASPLRTLKDLTDQLKRDPGSVKWGGGSRGGVDHIGAAMIAKDVGVDASKINYVPFAGGGEASAAVLGGHVTVGVSGWNEFQQFIKSGRVRALAVSGAQRIPGENVPTLREQGVNVDFGNWRGVYGAPDITAAQRTKLIADITAATKSKAWEEGLKNNDWFPAFMAGDEFGRFVDAEVVRLTGVMRDVGLVKA
jgi:putative tricarboxylic transport membrane protein